MPADPSAYQPQAQHTMNQRRADAFDRPEVFLTLGLALSKQGKGAALHELVAETLARHPGSPLYVRIAGILLSRRVPQYHGAMLRDVARNRAYRQAIEAVAKGRVVLDIGTGSGLLAMIAARAGAARVIACEAMPAVAETARAIIAANGLSDRIEVHACHSTDLDRATLAAMGVDLVVSEIFADDLLSEGVLRSLEHARAELCAPGALFLPESAAIRVALAQTADGFAFLDQVEGFDLSGFAGHVRTLSSFTQDDARLVQRSKPAELLRFAFAADSPIPTEGHAQVDLTCTGGRVSGVAQWLEIDFGNGLVYENAPCAPKAGAGEASTAHWNVVHHDLPEPVDLAAGSMVGIGAWYCGDTLALYPSSTRD